MTAAYYPNGKSASDVIPKLAKDNLSIAAGLHRAIKGQCHASRQLVHVLTTNAIDKYFRIG